MAVKKYNFLDESGVQVLANTILKAANNKIKDKMIDSSKPLTPDIYNDDQRTLTAKTILGLIGRIDEYDKSITGRGNTVLDKVKALKNAIGSKDDTGSTDSLYGAISKAKEDISNLNNITYKIVTGKINEVITPGNERTDVIYLQHDNPSPKVGVDGYLINDSGEHVITSDTIGAYKAYQNPSTKIITKVRNGQITDERVLPGDPILSLVSLVEDKTYNLYIWNNEWLCVGDTSIELNNFWDKSNNSINELKTMMFTYIENNTIPKTVDDAFKSITPFPE